MRTRSLRSSTARGSSGSSRARSASTSSDSPVAAGWTEGSGVLMTVTVPSPELGRCCTCEDVTGRTARGPRPCRLDCCGDLPQVRAPAEPRALAAAPAARLEGPSHPYAQGGRGGPSAAAGGRRPQGGPSPRPRARQPRARGGPAGPHDRRRALVLPLIKAELTAVFSGGMILVLWGGIALCVVDGFILRKRLRREVTERFGDVGRGVVTYGIMRAIQIRRFRLPRAQIKHGE